MSAFARAPPAEEPTYERLRARAASGRTDLEHRGVFADARHKRRLRVFAHLENPVCEFRKRINRQPFACIFLVDKRRLVFKRTHSAPSRIAEPVHGVQVFRTLPLFSQPCGNHLVAELVRQRVRQEPGKSVKRLDGQIGEFEYRRRKRHPERGHLHTHVEEFVGVLEFRNRTFILKEHGPHMRSPKIDIRGIMHLGTSFSFRRLLIAPRAYCPGTNSPYALWHFHRMFF